jgi:hypothetical protein
MVKAKQPLGPPMTLGNMRPQPTIADKQFDKNTPHQNRSKSPAWR